VSTTIRSASRDDAAEIAACLSALGYGTQAELVADRLDQFTSSGIDAVFVAEHAPGGRLLGVASAHALPLFHAPGQLVRLTALAVRNEAQGSGVGRALVAAVEAWAWQLGARRVEVTSGDHRPVAHTFYQAIGYALDERRFIKRAPEVLLSGS